MVFSPSGDPGRGDGTEAPAPEPALGAQGPYGGSTLACLYCTPCCFNQWQACSQKGETLRLFHSIRAYFPFFFSFSFLLLFFLTRCFSCSVTFKNIIVFLYFIYTVHVYNVWVHVWVERLIFSSTYLNVKCPPFPPFLSIFYTINFLSLCKQIILIKIQTRVLEHYNCISCGRYNSICGDTSSRQAEYSRSIFIKQIILRNITTSTEYIIVRLHLLCEFALYLISKTELIPHFI